MTPNATKASLTGWLLKGDSSSAAALQTLLTKILVLVLNVLTGVITARLLGPAGRGEQAAMILWPPFLATALTLGIPSALVYNLKQPGNRSELFGASIVLALGASTIGALVGFFCMPWWLARYSPEVIAVARWFMIAVPFGMLGLLMTSALEGMGKFSVSNLERLLQAGITLAILGLLAWSGLLTPFTSGMAYLLPILPLMVWRLFYLWPLVRPRLSGFAASSRKLFSYGLRSYGIDLVGTLSGQIDQVLVIGLLAPSAMGMYTVALSLSRMLNVFQGAVVAVLFPKAAGLPALQVVALTGRAARISTALTFLVSLALFLLGPVVLGLFYGPEYSQAIQIFQILMVEVVLNGTVWVLAQAFMALGKPGAVTVLQSAGLALSVPLMLVLIPAWGVIGAGVALLVSTTIRLGLMLASYPLLLKVKAPDLLLNRDDISYLKRTLFKR